MARHELRFDQETPTSSAPSVAEIASDSQGEAPRRSHRPSRLNDFVGQRAAREALGVALSAATERGEAMDHLLLHGPPGLGKTTLAMLAAREIGARCVRTAGPVLERPADLAGLLSSLDPRDVLFIDEVHRLTPALEEFLYPAMEDGRMDIRLDRGLKAKTIQVELPAFTLIAATTRLGLLSAPLRSRFGMEIGLEPYPEEDLVAVIESGAERLEVDVRSSAARLLAGASRGTPRLALRLLRRARDVAEVEDGGAVTEAVARRALALAGRDRRGLSRQERGLLSALVEHHGGGPVGLQLLATLLHEDTVTIETVVEPHLVRSGLLRRTPRGRIVTEGAYRHLGLEAPEVPSL